MALNYMLQIIIVLLVSAAGTVKQNEPSIFSMDHSRLEKLLQLVDMLHIQE